MAEGELSVWQRQCLDRRIPDYETLQAEVEAWERARNAKQVPMDWQFRTQEARIKLKRLYPVLKEQTAPAQEGCLLPSRQLVII